MERNWLYVIAALVIVLGVIGIVSWNTGNVGTTATDTGAGTKPPGSATGGSTGTADRPTAPAPQNTPTR